MEQQSIDRQTFDRLILDHLPAAQRFAIRLCGNADEAEEIVQEALSRAARGWRTFAGRSSFRTWLFQIVVNSFRTNRASRSESEELRDDLKDSRAVAPVERVAAAELAAIVARHVSTLPARQREVLVLSAYEQLSSAEIASVLGISAENVRVNLHLARVRLRRDLKAYLPESFNEHKSTPS